MSKTSDELRELEDGELDGATGGLVVNSIIGVYVGQLNHPVKEAPAKHWFNGG